MTKPKKVAFQGEPGANSHLAIVEAYPDAEVSPDPSASPEYRTNSAKRDGVGAAYQLLIRRGEQSGLLTNIATTEHVSLCVRMKS